MDFKKIIKMFDNTVINEQVGPGAVSAVARASGIADPNKIRPGQKITIPTAGGGFATTTVKQGDTLSGIIKQMQGRQDFKVDTRSPAVKPAEPITPVPAQTTPGGGPGTQQQLARRLGQNAPYTPPGLQSARATPGQTSTVTTPDATAPTPAPTVTEPAAPKSKEIPTITTTGGPTADNPVSTTPKPEGGPAVTAGFNQSTNLSTEPLDQIARRGPMGTTRPAPAVDAQGNRVQTKGFVDTVQDIFKKNPTPPTPAGVQDPTGLGNQDFYSGIRGNKTEVVPTDTGMEMRPLNTQSGNNTTQNFAEEELQDLEEELNEMLRLSGIMLSEKAVSKQQQKFMGMVHAMQKGEKVKGASPELKKAAKTMGKKDAKDFASTKHKGLPKKVTEGLNLMLDEEGHTLNHIVNKYKHEVKSFLDGAEMSENLYDALYDYYLDRGDMPYGVAKAREGDPYQWVANRFYSDIGGSMNEAPMYEVAADDTLNELARLAGLSESRVDECGDMGMDMEDRLNVSTNMSSDGTKSVNISAQGEKAEELLSMLKLAGMGDKMPRVSDGVDMDHPGAIEIHGTMDADGAEQLARSLRSKSRDEEMMDEGGVPIQQIPPVEPKSGERTWPYIPQPGGSAHADAEGRRVTPRAPAALEEMDNELDEAKKKTRVTKHANTPDEEYQTVASITRQGNDLNREKKQFANMPKAGDNPMATDYMLDEELSALLDSVLVKEVDPRRPPGDTGIADIYTAGKGIAPPSPDEGPINYPKKIQPQQPKATEPSMKNMPLPKTAPEPSMKNMPLPKGQEPRTKPM